MGFLGLLQRIAIQGLQPLQSMWESPTAREGALFYREEKESESSNEQGVHGFSLAESLPGKKRSLSSSYWAPLSSQGM